MGLRGFKGVWGFRVWGFGLIGFRAYRVYGIEFRVLGLEGLGFWA